LHINLLKEFHSLFGNHYLDKTAVTGARFPFQQAKFAHSLDQTRHIAHFIKHSLTNEIDRCWLGALPTQNAQNVKLLLAYLKRFEKFGMLRCEPISRIDEIDDCSVLLIPKSALHNFLFNAWHGERDKLSVAPLNVPTSNFCFFWQITKKKRRILPDTEQLSSFSKEIR
jgi:hypothetical protein